MIYNIKEQNFESPDDFYEVLVNAHDGLSDDESRRLNAKIILLLANAIGNKAVSYTHLTLPTTPYV